MPETTKKTITVKKKTVKKPVRKTVSKTTKKPKTVVKQKSSTTRKIVTKTTKKPKTIEKSKTVTQAKKTVSKKIVRKAVVKKPIRKIIKRKTPVKKIWVNKVNFIKWTFKDILKLYKNFIHWNISKLIVLVLSFILWIIILLPLVIVIYSLLSYSFIDSLLSVKNILWNVLYFIFTILLIKLNFSYIDWKKLWYKISNYFDFKKIIKIFNLTLLNGVILLIPAILFYIIISLMILAFWGQESVTNILAWTSFGFFQILSLVLFVLTVLSTVYLLYRIIFSYFVLFDLKDTKDSVIKCIKESFNKTKKIKTFLKYSVIFIMFLFLLSPVNYLWIILKENNMNLFSYNTYLNLSDEYKWNLSWDNLYYVESLKLKYKDLSVDDVDTKIKINNLYIIIFNILNFVFLSGLFVMITSSFYKRELS